MKVYRIDQADLISLFGERKRINPSPSAHISERLIAGRAKKSIRMQYVTVTGIW